MKIIFNLVFGFICSTFVYGELIHNIYMGSRENDPTSLVENVSVIHGDYSEQEIDLVVSGPDALVLSRFYSSRDSLSIATFGGWRFHPHCFLSLQKDSALVGTSEGSILHYVRDWKNSSLFRIDLMGFVNTARGPIRSWTNLKNNVLSFDEESDTFTLALSNGGERHYAKHCSLGLYLLLYETLPSGNKIFYEYDQQGQLILLKATNVSEKKIFSWIKIQYGRGIHVEASDGKVLDYHFEEDSSGYSLLTEVIRPDKPHLHYYYQVFDQCALLVKKEWPEGRCVCISYSDDAKHRVQAVSTPLASTQFFYEIDRTEVRGPLGSKSIYRFNEELELLAVEQYLNGLLYRTQKKVWGEKEEARNLIVISVEDGESFVLYHKTLSYDKKGNIVKECEFGNLTGIDNQATIEQEEEAHTKTYTYRRSKEGDILEQKDTKGNGIQSIYRKGTNLLITKLVFEKSEIKKREFYHYDEDAVLMQIIVDDGSGSDPKSLKAVTEQHLTAIFPKQSLPNVGAPEIIEEAYLNLKEKKKKLLKKTCYCFDPWGRIICEEIYDSRGDHRYSLKKTYNDRGLLILETDPLGNEVHYSHNANLNCTVEHHIATGLSFEYGYDLQNRLVSIVEKDKGSRFFETKIAYDAAGNKSFELDHFGHATLYKYDDLGRLLSVSYPEIREEKEFSARPTYSYIYDFFDHPISVTDPTGSITSKSYNVRGQPTGIHYSDESYELFKYDPEGSLHRYCDREGTVRVFEYDYLGRVLAIEQYERGNTGPGNLLRRTSYQYNAFHLLSEETEVLERGQEEDVLAKKYNYDQAGRLSRLREGSKQIDFAYDSLGRPHTIKKWTAPSTFILEIKEHDLLGHVIEERTEDEHRTILLKQKYQYDSAGRLSKIIGYPQNRESALIHYQYDDFGRLIKVIDAFQHVTRIMYDDHYVNEWGQRVNRRIQVDSFGNEQEEIFDTRNQLTKMSKRSAEGQLLTQKEFFHDAMGNKIQEKNFLLSSGKVEACTTQWVYSPGQQLQKIIRSGEAGQEQITDFQYNSQGKLSAKYNPAKEPIFYEYDNEGKLVTLSYKKNQFSKSYQFSYDLKGRIKKVLLGSSGILNYEFDEEEFSEVIQDKWGGYQVHAFYDKEGRVESLELPNRDNIQFIYTGPFVKKATYFVDENAIEDREDLDGFELYNYQVKARDQMGQLLEEIVATEYRKQSWDQSGRKTEITTHYFKEKNFE